MITFKSRVEKNEGEFARKEGVWCGNTSNVRTLEQYPNKDAGL